MQGTPSRGNGQSSEGGPAEPAPLSKGELRKLVLELVEARPGIQESELAAELQGRSGRPEPTLLKLFRKMEEKGLLERGSQGGRQTLYLPGAVRQEPADEEPPPPAPAEVPPPPARPPEREEPSAPRDRRILLGGLVLAVLVGVAVVTVVLTSGDDGSPKRSADEGKQVRERSAARDEAKKTETEPQPSPSAVALTEAKRASTAVLSGSAEPGIATRTGEELKEKGFKVATVGNAASGSARSVVLYATASRRAQAKALARSLGIKTTKRLDPLNAEQAVGAQLVVLVGADRERNAPEASGAA